MSNDLGTLSLSADGIGGFLAATSTKGLIFAIVAADISGIASSTRLASSMLTVKLFVFKLTVRLFTLLAYFFGDLVFVVAVVIGSPLLR